MRRIFLFLVALLLFLPGCGSLSKVPRLQDYAWSLSSVQSVAQNGQVIACQPGEGAFWGNADAKEIEWECIASKDTLVFVDKATGKRVTGEVRQMEATPESNVYEGKIGEKTVIAVVAMTTYADQSQRPTFILKLEEYILNFYSIGKG